MHANVPPRRSAATIHRKPLCLEHSLDNAIQSFFNWNHWKACAACCLRVMLSLLPVITRTAEHFHVLIYIIMALPTRKRTVSFRRDTLDTFRVWLERVVKQGGRWELITRVTIYAYYISWSSGRAPRPAFVNLFLGPIFPIKTSDFKSDLSLIGCKQWGSVPSNDRHITKYISHISNTYTDKKGPVRAPMIFPKSCLCR